MKLNIFEPYLNLAFKLYEYCNTYSIFYTFSIYKIARYLPMIE